MLAIFEVILLYTAINVVCMLVVIIIALRVARKRVNATKRSLNVSIQEKIDNLYSQIEALGNLNRMVNNPAIVTRLRGWALSPDILCHIVEMVRDERPEVVVEFGSGMSTLLIAETLMINGCGRLISFDHDLDYYSDTKKRLDVAGLGKFVDLRYAKLKQVTVEAERMLWYDLDVVEDAIGDSTVEFVIIDGPPETIKEASRYPALVILKEKLSEGIFVVVDDTNRAKDKANVDRWRKNDKSLELKELYTEKGAVLMYRGRGRRSAVNTQNP